MCHCVLYHREREKRAYSQGLLTAETAIFKDVQKQGSRVRRLRFHRDLRKWFKKRTKSMAVEAGSPLHIYSTVTVTSRCTFFFFNTSMHIFNSYYLLQEAHLFMQSPGQRKSFDGLA